MLESPFAFLRESGSEQSAGMHCKAENWVVTTLITSSSLLDCTTASTGQMGRADWLTVGRRIVTDADCALTSSVVLNWVN